MSSAARRPVKNFGKWAAKTPWVMIYLRKLYWLFWSSFFILLLLLFYFFLEKKLRWRWVFSYCTASSLPKIWPRLPQRHSGHWTIKTMIIRELLANTNSIAFNYEYLYIFPIFCYSMTMIIGLLKITFEVILSTP